ncbi:MAG: hypothetical protein ACRCUY_05350 [Thermoguttaceae bacterium]
MFCSSKVITLSFALLPLCLLFVVVGCAPDGPAVNFVEGTILFNDVPLTNADISFVPQQEGGTEIFAIGKTDENGHFTLTAMQGGSEGKGTTQGEYNVALIRYDENKSRFEPMPGMSGEKVEIKMSLIPERYTKPNTSGLKATIKSGKNKCDFKLEAK